MPSSDTAVRLGMAAAHRCRRRVHLDHDPDADHSLQRPIDDGVQLRLDVLAAHRRAVGGRLRMTPPGSGGPDGRIDAAEALRRHDPLIWQPRLETGHRTGAPDLLVLMPDGGYVPVLIRGHRTTDPGMGAELTGLDEVAEWVASLMGSDGARIPPLPIRAPAKKLRPHSVDISALAHLYRMLQELGLASATARGGVIGYGGPAGDAGWDDGAVIAWHRLDASAGDSTALADYDARFADRLAVATAAATRRPALAQPSRIGECRRCPWWTVCGPQLQTAHDVSLLVSGADVDVLRGAGARRYDEVAAMSLDTLMTLPLSGMPAAELRIRARAMTRGLPVVRRVAGAAVTRADVELDVDMESYGDDGAYLWGTYLSGAELTGFTAGYRPFVTWEPLASAGTARNFVEFWQYLRSLRAACAERGLTLAAYCYSHRAEERWLYGTPERFPGEPGMPDRAEVEEFCESPQWVDLYVEMRRIFVIPGSMRLKALAPLSGFAWRDPDPGGANSMAWYRIAVGEGGRDGRADPAEVAANRERILRYNEDDVLATLRLRHWVSGPGRQVPTVAELDAGWP